MDEFGLAKYLGKPLLDVGCGEGFWAGLFTEFGFQTYGFDVDDTYLETARSNYPQVQFQNANVNDPLPYEKGMFGVIFARQLPCFYAYRLTGMRKAIKNLLALEPDLLLLGVYSDGSGEKRQGADEATMFWHHKHD